LTEITDRAACRARAQLLARQFNARLAAEGLSVKGRRDRRAQADTAAIEAAERRHLRALRRRPGYAAGEARQPFEPEARLIRTGRPDPVTGRGAGEPPTRPTFEEMRARAEAYPAVPAEVRERKRAERRNRRKR
jgi:hypothetical protein